MPSTMTLRLATPRDVLHTQRNAIWNANAPREGLHCSVLVVYDRLVSHADKNGVTWVRVTKLARECKRSERTVHRALATLRAAGMVESRTLVTRRGRANTYRLLRVEDAANDVHRRELVVAARERPAPALDHVREDDHASGDDTTSVEESARFSAPGSCHGDSTHPAMVAGPPPAAPYSDRTQENATPCIPPLRVGTPEASPRSLEKKSEKAARAETWPGTRPSLDAVERVLKFFLAQLWPNARSQAVTRKRRKLVVARLAELSPELAEETLMDAVRGAKLHPWHREASTGFFAEKVFRDADTVEQLAGLGRSKRLQDARRAQGQGRQAPAALGRSKPIVAPVRAGVDADRMQADIAALFGSAFAARLAAS